MFDSKLKVEKVEMVKRIIRQNNYHHYEKTHRQCIDLGLNVNRAALDRFANKLELIDKAGLSKRQNELQQLELARQQGAQQPAHMSTQVSTQSYQQNIAPQQQSISAHNSGTIRQPSVHNTKMTYEQVKQRETEITFALGELKIRESELLQELISLSELLDNNQIN